MRMTRVVGVVGVAVASLALSGCFEVTSEVTIGDGVADIALTSTVDTAAFDGLLSSAAGELGDEFTEGLTPDSVLDEVGSCGDLFTDIGEFDVVETPIDDGSLIGVRCEVSQVPLEQLSTVSADGSMLSVTQADGSTTFEWSFDASELLGETSDTEELTSLLGVSLDELFKVTFVASAPGELTDSNATSVDGATARWEVTSDASFVGTDGTAVMAASWDDQPAASTSWVTFAALAGVLLAAVGAVGAFMMYRTSKAAVDVGEAMSEPLASPTAPAAPSDVVTQEAPSLTDGPSAPPEGPSQVLPPPPPAS